MRRQLIVIAAVALVASGAYAGIHWYRACHSESARGAIAGNFDPAMSGVCRFACATTLEYQPADVIAQPGAQPGKLTQCPVSGVVFVVDPGRPHVSVAAKEFVACCRNCAEKLQHNPGQYIKA